MFNDDASSSCSVPCEYCGELVCRDSSDTTCSLPRAVIVDEGPLTMTYSTHIWACAGCIADGEAETAAELEGAVTPEARAAIVADGLRAWREGLYSAVVVNDAEETETERLPVVTMMDMVYGVRRRPVAPWMAKMQRLLVIFALGSATAGCAAHVSAPAEVETVGTLAPSYHGIASAPLAHDAPPELGQVQDTGLDAAGEVAVTQTADAGELPAVVDKDRGLKTGEVRK